MVDKVVCYSGYSAISPNVHRASTSFIESIVSRHISSGRLSSIKRARSISVIFFESIFIFFYKAETSSDSLGFKGLYATIYCKELSDGTQFQIVEIGCGCFEFSSRFLSP